MLREKICKWIRKPCVWFWITFGFFLLKGIGWLVLLGLAYWGITG